MPPRPLPTPLMPPKKPANPFQYSQVPTQLFHTSICMGMTSAQQHHKIYRSTHRHLYSDHGCVPMTDCNWAKQKPKFADADSSANVAQSSLNASSCRGHTHFEHSKIATRNGTGWSDASHLLATTLPGTEYQVIKS